MWHLAHTDRSINMTCHVSRLSLPQLERGKRERETLTTVSPSLLPPDKLLGHGFSTLMPFFCLICTIISNKPCIWDQYQKTKFESSGVDTSGRVRHPLYSRCFSCGEGLLQEGETLVCVCVRERLLQEGETLVCVCVCVWERETLARRRDFRVCVCVCVCVCVWEVHTPRSQGQLLYRVLLALLPRDCST